jgi:hypothetical protein
MEPTRSWLPVDDRHQAAKAERSEQRSAKRQADQGHYAQTIRSGHEEVDAEQQAKSTAKDGAIPHVSS